MSSIRLGFLPCLYISIWGFSLQQNTTVWATIGQYGSCYGSLGITASGEWIYPGFPIDGMISFNFSLWRVLPYWRCHMVFSSSGNERSQIRVRPQTQYHLTGPNLLCEPYQCCSFPGMSTSLDTQHRWMSSPAVTTEFSFRMTFSILGLVSARRDDHKHNSIGGDIISYILDFI